MWVALLIIAIAIAFFYLNNKGKDIQQTLREGGMYQKFKYVVDFAMRQDKRAQISHESGDQIHVQLLTSGGQTLFMISKSGSNLKIKWKTVSSVYGTQTKEWTFPVDYDQVLITQKISDDLRNIEL